MLVFSSLWSFTPLSLGMGRRMACTGLQDFAGGTVVHITAGVAALVAAVSGWTTRVWPDCHATTQPHDDGDRAGMLWVGWFGFNAGSAVAADSSADGDVGHASIGSLWFAGMDDYGVVTTWKALRIGYRDRDGGRFAHHPRLGFSGSSGRGSDWTVAGVICYFATITLENRLGVDDSLDVFPVHGGGMRLLMAGRRFHLRWVSSVATAFRRY